MRNMTENTGFVAGFAKQLQQFRIAEVGTVVCGRSTMSVVFVEGFLADAGLGTGGDVEGFGGHEAFHTASTTERVLSGNGSAVSGNHELALARGKRLMERIEATPRYGAPGECPRKIPA